MTDRLKVTITNYETAFIQQHLKAYIGKVRRYEPNLEDSHARMTNEHKLIQFNARHDMQVSAYQMFQFHVKMIQTFIQESKLFFSGSLENVNQMFGDFDRLEHVLLPQDCEGTIFPLITNDGKLPIPRIYIVTVTRNLWFCMTLPSIS